MSGQLDICSQMYPAQMYPPVEASSDQKHYYISSPDWVLLLSGYEFLKIEQESTVCM